MPEVRPAPVTARMDQNVPASDLGESEAYQVLLARVGRKSPKIPADLLVRHVLACVPAREWPARVEAMDALLRRLESARNDGLRVDARPGDRRALGHYSTHRKGSDARPYRTLLRGVDPIDGRCDCPDFLKNSLGACKHILTVLEDLYARPRRLKQAKQEQSASLASASASAPVGLSWDPIRPLTGEGDWLERVTWSGPPAGKRPKPAETAVRSRWFRLNTLGVLVPKKTFLDEPAKRLALVEVLGNLVRSAGRGRWVVDPALDALLKAERTRLSQLLERKLRPSELRKALKALKRPLYPYQREGVERFLAQGRLLLADDMGLGKTAQAIACCDVLRRCGRVRRGLVIAPASLKPQWAREWNTFSELSVSVVDGTPAERQALYAATRQGVLIINYEQLLRDLEVIRRWAPDLVVLDEAQRIKNWATKTALSVKGLTPSYRLVLTGTPMENRIEELASVVEWVDDMALEPKWRLGAIHAIRSEPRDTGKGKATAKGEVTGVRHLDTLRLRLRHCMLRRIRQEVLDQLPPRTDVRIPIELTEPQREEHDALIQPIVQLMRRSQTRPLTQPEFLRLMSLLTTQRIISNGLAQLRFEDVWPTLQGRAPEEGLIQGLSSPKLLELRQLIRQIVLDQGRKVVVFSQWRRMLALAHWAVNDLLTEHSLRAGFFTGAEGQKRRTQNIVEFHDDPDFRVLYATDAGGVGLNLQRAANCVINLELPWNPAVLEQRIGRVYRLGQTLPIDAYNLVSEQGIESRIASLVGSKQAFFKGLFDGESDTVQFDQAGSFLARVETLYEAHLNSSGIPDGLGDDFQGVGDDLVIGAGDVDPEADGDVGLDDAADPFGPMIEAGDESRDAPASPDPSTPDGPDLTDAQAMTDSTSATTEASDVRRLFSRLQVRREGDGRVVIEAPPEAASALTSLFEGMAAMLRSVSEAGGGG